VSLAVTIVVATDPGSTRPTSPHESGHLPLRCPRRLTWREVNAVAIIIGVVALAVGWVLGMWTRKRSDRWCVIDGTKLSCPRCTTAGLHSLGSSANPGQQVSSIYGGGSA
jgi:hypothetical protein